MNQFTPQSELELVSEQVAPLMDGQIPDWITQKTSGGTITSHDASNNGGYLELDPGTASSGDFGKIETFDIQPNAFDVVELSARIQSTTADISDLKLTYGFEESGSNSILHSWVNNDPSNAIRTRAGGSDTHHETREHTDTNQHIARLIWDTDRGSVSLKTDGYPAAVDKSAGLPDPSLSYFGQVTAEYNGGSSAQVRVYSLALRYYTRSN